MGVTSRGILVATFLLVMATSVRADGNLAANGVDLPDLKIDTTKLAFSQTEYDLQTGKYYRLNVTVDDGADNLSIVMPELLRNAWLEKVTIDNVQVHAPSVDSIELDGAATFQLTFVPIRPGEYDFWAPGYDKRGLKGKFVVK